MLTAIYYPKTSTLSYWTPKEKDKYPIVPRMAHAYLLKTEAAARAYLKEHITRTEVVQELEVFK